MAVALRETSFELPGQVGEPYHGKVGDTYTIEHDAGELLAVVRTDRFSAFDVVLPDTVPLKGQVLNQMSAELLVLTQSVAPNWLIESPDPNVSIGYKAKPFKVELIARGYLLGKSWRGYKEGVRELCGYQLPNGMTEFQAFDTPLLTPTTKADAGHDENITPGQIAAEGLATAEEYDEIAHLALGLFAVGQATAQRRGLVLADAKYEFGRLATGQIVVIDEVHTPDSSRYFSLDEYSNYLDGQVTQRPEQLSKEFVREWLVSQGFRGEPGQQPPHMPESFRKQISDRYIDLYQRMLGHEFQAATETSEAALLDRVYQNIVDSLGRLSVA
jgi:phosphoribosylaminoimidazole-succinocarboxamide synthase